MERLLAYAGLGIMLCINGACAANGEQARPMPAPAHKAQQQPSYISRQVVVRLCSDVSSRQLADALASHRLRVAGRASAVILTLDWQDARSVEQVVAELKGSGVFCAAQPNYLYHTQPAGPGQMIEHPQGK